MKSNLEWANNLKVGDRVYLLENETSFGSELEKFEIMTITDKGSLRLSDGRLYTRSSFKSTDGEIVGFMRRQDYSDRRFVEVYCELREEHKRKLDQIRLEKYKKMLSNEITRINDMERIKKVYRYLDALDEGE